MKQTAEVINKNVKTVYERQPQCLLMDFNPLSESESGDILNQNQSHLAAGAADVVWLTLWGRGECNMLIHPHVDIQRFVKKENNYLYLQRKAEGWQACL